jgi:retinol dehydrogenase-13
VVTGANTGLGLETAVGLAEQGFHVVLTSRDATRGQAALADVRRRTGSDSVEVRPLDLASFASIRAFARDFLAAHDRLDVLVNNAGVAPAGRRWETADGFEATFGVNHLGHFLLTSLLLDRLSASAPARIVVVASGAYAYAPSICFDDLQHRGEFHSFRVYAESKLANLLFVQELARRLEGSGVTVNAVSPGYVATALGRIRDEDLAHAEDRPQPGTGGQAPGEPMPVDVGARTSIMVATEAGLDGVSGRCFSPAGDEAQRPHATHAEAAARLWAESERLIAAGHP